MSVCWVMMMQADETGVGGEKMDGDEDVMKMTIVT